MRLFFLIVLMLGMIASRAPAEALAMQPASRPATDDPNHRITEHQLKAGDAVLTYRATAGTLQLTDDNAKPKAGIFYVAYERTGAGIDRASRPITYVFNGGPGAAAVWLHLGTAGPRAIALPNDGNAPPPPYRLEANPDSWLASTDLVFIDPVGTGFSRPADGEKGEQFYGLKEDIAWVAEFIRLYTTRNNRWASPMFLAGESYGTTRAAGLADHLLDEHGIALNGIILISSVLDFATIRSGEGNDLPSIVFLPTYTATAYFHKRLPRELQDRPLEQLLDEVQEWAVETYLPSLAKGAALSDPRRNAVATRLAAYTGLKLDIILAGDLRIEPGTFMGQLLSDLRRVVGRFDGRITGDQATPLQIEPAYDPSLSRFLPIYTSTFGDYVRRDLRFETDLKYEVLSRRVWPWNFGRGGDGYVNVAGDLSMAMTRNPSMRVMFASGYEDLATPFYATHYTINHLSISPELRRNITEHRYAGGHMMYHLRSSRQKLGQDVRRFIEQSVREPESSSPLPGAPERTRQDSNLRPSD